MPSQSLHGQASVAVIPRCQVKMSEVIMSEVKMSEARMSEVIMSEVTRLIRLHAVYGYASDITR